MNKVTDLTLKWLAQLAYEHEPLITLPIEQGWAPYLNFLYYLAEHMNPTWIVELGVLHGLSIAHLSAGSPSSTVVGIDISLSGLCHELPCPNRVIFIEGDPLEIDLRFPLMTNLGIGILFIDSEHTYETTMAQYKKFRPLMVPGGVICLDDIHLGEGMDRVWQEISEPKIELPMLHEGQSSFGVVICE